MRDLVLIVIALCGAAGMAATWRDKQAVTVIGLATVILMVIVGTLSTIG